MRAVVDDRAHLQRMLDFEAALARAEAAVAVIPAGSVEAIANAAKAELYDCAAIGEAAVRAGNIATPLVEALTAEVAKTDSWAARYVNWGATAQDIIDTALMLELRAGIDVLLTDLNRAIEGFVALAGRHRRTATVARTLLQHALPMPFGLKLAGYAAALARSRERLRRLRREALALQFGGAAGTLAALGEHGLAVTDRLAALLDLPAPDAPWHGHSDRLAEIASALAMLTGTCGKIARDLAILMQTEVGRSVRACHGRTRAATGPSRRRSANQSSPRPRSRRRSWRPISLATVVAGQMQEHERAARRLAGAVACLSRRCCSSPPALLEAIAELAQRLYIDTERMRNNLEIAQGMIMAEAVTDGARCQDRPSRCGTPSSTKPAVRPSAPSVISTAFCPKTRV